MGKNNQGQLGNNTSRTIKQAVQVQGLPETQEEILLALGSDHSCALIQRSKQVYCWGSHSAGQLGIGKTSDDKALKAVLVGKHQENGVTKDRFNMATQILQISARGQHTCAVVQEPMKQSPGKNQPKQVSFVNRAWCWGKRNQQDLNTLPTLINESPKNVLAIAVGENHVCALEQHGNIFCWGSNPFGQLGTNDQKNRRVPVKITLSQNNPSLLATEIVSGKDHSCALAQGSVYCWGANHQGQTGQNPSQSIILSPQKVEFLGNTVVSLTAGDFHTCAALENGTIRCFGSDQDFEFPGLF